MRVLLWLSIGLDRRSPSEHLLTAVVEALCARGHTVHILQKDTGGDRSEIPPRMAELGVTTTRIKCLPPARSDLTARYIADIRYVLACRKWLRRHHAFARVFLQSSNVAGVQMLALHQCCRGVPVVFNVQDIFPENAVISGAISAKGMAYRALSAMQKYAYRHADRIITISEDMLDMLTELGVRGEKIEVIYNWSYQDEPYDPQQLDLQRVASYFDRTKFNVVYAGNIGRMQNVEVLIRAAAKMQAQKDIAFHVFGEGVSRKKLMDLAQQLKAENVAFHPMLDSQEAPALYCSADVNVIPLARGIFRTALPSKTATCLACGKPIIFALGKESAFAKYISEQTGCPVVDCDDENELIRAIHAIQANACPCSTQAVFRQAFGKWKNASRYARMIERARAVTQDEKIQAEE